MRFHFLFLMSFYDQARDVAANNVFVVGYNDYGQLGLGDFLQRSTETLLGMNLPLTVTNGAGAGLYHNLAFGDAGSETAVLYSWPKHEGPARPWDSCFTLDTDSCVLGFLSNSMQLDLLALIVLRCLPR